MIEFSSILELIFMNSKKTPFIERRLHLLKCMRGLGGGVAIIHAAPRIRRNSDIYYPYRQDSDFYYLTGFSEPRSCLILVSGYEDRCILFCKSQESISEIWEGSVCGPNKAVSLYGFDEAYSIDKLQELAPFILMGYESVYMKLTSKDNWKDLEEFKNWILVAQEKKSGNQIIPSRFFNIDPLLSEMRLIKDFTEISHIKKSAEISALSHREIMKSSRIGMTEREVAAELLYHFSRNGSNSIAYDSIVAFGKNACTLHHSPGDSVLQSGDLLLIDAGCEINNYASDITRTFPIDGKYTTIQLLFYEIVLEAQKAAIELAVPGNKYNKIHEAATRILIQGMLDEKLLEGCVENIMESGQYKEFYPHYTSHWLGLDVHDVGDYYEINCNKNSFDFHEWRTLKNGMVLTIEPGIYIRPNQRIPKELWNIGIRIEDTVIITRDGPEIITRSIPVEPTQIEILIQSNK